MEQSHIKKKRKFRDKDANRSPNNINHLSTFNLVPGTLLTRRSSSSSSDGGSESSCSCTSGCSSCSTIGSGRKWRNADDALEHLIHILLQMQSGRRAPRRRDHR